MSAVELAGFDEFDRGTVEMIRSKMGDVLRKYEKIFGSEGVKNLRLHVKTLKKGGKRDVHELTLSLETNKGDYRVKRSGWEILSLVDEVESILESQFKKKKEKFLVGRDGR